MRRLTFRNGWDLKQLKSGIEVILHILICFSGMPMWAYIKDSCKQLFLLQDSMARSKAVCLDFKSGTPGGAWFEGTSQSGLATVWEREIQTRLSPKEKASDKNRSLKTWRVGVQMIPAGEKTDWRSAERSKSFWWKWPGFAKSDTWNNSLLNPQWVWYKARVDGSQISHFDTTLHFDWLPVTFDSWSPIILQGSEERRALIRADICTTFHHRCGENICQTLRATKCKVMCV